MKLSETNDWLSLVANVGVLIGIVFLIVELDQSNRIASYAAENARRNQFIELNSSRIEHSETYAKLQANVSDLSPAERAEAVMMARQLLNTWQDAEAAYNYGLLSDLTFRGTLLDVAGSIEEAPGLIPFFEYLIDLYQIDTQNTQVSEQLVEVIRGNATNI